MAKFSDLRGPTGGTDSRNPFCVLALSEAEIQRLLDPVQLLDALAQGLIDLAKGRFQTPARTQITVPERGFLLSMPAWREGSPIAVKMVSVFEGNAAQALPNHVAVINLYAPDTGIPICVMDGTYITGIRTAGAAALSVRELARPDARIATIVGAGVQGQQHLKLLPLVRDIEEIQIYSLRAADAVKLAERHPIARPVVDLEQAVRRSDLICLASHAYQPVIEASWVTPGTHVTSVGYAPPHGELPPTLAKENTLFIEDKAAFAAPPEGCGELQGIDPANGICLGEMLLGRRPGRTCDDEITVYKAMGIAMEDAVAAELAYHCALRESKEGTLIL